MMAQQAAQAVTRPANMLRVLIADDHDLLRDTLQIFLEGEGTFETVCVASYSEAEALVKAGEQFDLVLLDYSMPGMNAPKPLMARLSGSAER